MYLTWVRCKGEESSWLDLFKYHQLTTFWHPLKNSISLMGSLTYDRMRLAFSPLGGSLVILTPFCSTETGKWGEG